MPTPRIGETRDEMNERRRAPELVVKGTSIFSKGGVEVGRWDKTRQRGRDDADVVHIPNPRTITKVSTLYDQLGEVTQQWVAEKPEDVQRQAAWAEWAKALAEDLPRALPLAAPVDTNSDLMACYPVGDHHMGMLSWRQETGSSYDIDTGERLLAGAMEYLAGVTPSCDHAAVVFLGDFMHYDSFDNVTPTSRNLLDSDGRFPKMVRASVRAMRRAIETAAARHREVLVIVEIGNHDLASSIFLMEALHNIYENNPRITVDTSPKHFHYFNFGKNLVGVHHGHGAKTAELPMIMAHDRPELWGATTHRYWWTGHIHTQKRFDYQGCSVESFRILAPADAWAANKGYRAERDMKAIVLHREHGEVARYVVNPSMLEV